MPRIERCGGRAHPGVHLFDPRRRLQRPIPGDYLAQEGAVTLRLCKRLEQSEPREVVPERKRELGYHLRENRVRVDPRPNAPQLVRLVRHPFALSVQHFRSVHAIDHGRADHSRPRFGAEHAAASEEIAVKLREGPIAVHDRFQPRARPSVVAWLASRPDPTEDR